MSQKRSQARSHAVQALYQWQMTGADVGDIVNQFLAEHGGEGFEVGYFRELLSGVTGRADCTRPASDSAFPFGTAVSENTE